MFATQANAAVYPVSSASEISSLATSLFPGDTVLLAAKTWLNEEVVFKGNGSETKPIVFMGDETMKTIFTGTSRMKIAGNYLEVKNVVFRECAITEEVPVIEFRDGSLLANHSRLTNVTIDAYSPANKEVDSKYVSLYGTYNRVDHCSFSGKTNSGATLVVWLDATPDYHQIDHNYFGSRPDLGVNGGETIRIGTSDWESYNSNCIVELNVFEECDGEIEIISNKSVGNIYRYNTFTNCNGTLTLRHGSYCKVYGNFFFGGATKNSGGIRLIGEGHEVYNNYLENLNGTSFRAAICLVNGIPDSPANGYKQVLKASIGYNTIVNCRQAFAIGAEKSTEKSLAPANSVIENNLVITSGSSAEVVKEYDTSAGISWTGNITNATSTGMATPSGFTTGATLPMVSQGDLQRPTTGNQAIGAALTGAFDTLSVDIDGQARPSSLKDVGCDQQSDNQILIRPLTKEDVGPSYSITTAASDIKKSVERYYVKNDQLTIAFDGYGDRIISTYTLDGKLLSKSKTNDNQYLASVSGFPQLFIVEIRDSGGRYSMKLNR